MERFELKYRSKTYQNFIRDNFNNVDIYDPDLNATFYWRGDMDVYVENLNKEFKQYTRQILEYCKS